MPEWNKAITYQHLRLLAARYELRRSIYKVFVKAPKIPGELREKMMHKLGQSPRNSSGQLPRNGSFTRVRNHNRSIMTGRHHGVCQVFRMSRIVFEELASNGMINGVKKSSW